MDNFEVDICVATYKRPNELAILLDSLNNLDLTNIRMRVIVIDNDKNRTAEKSIAQANAHTILNIHYEVEPNQGISYARNRALDNVKAPYAAFLDDDEFVNTDWLQKMLTTLNEYKADVVFGPVKGILSPTAPRWAYDHPSFSPVRKATGSIVEHGASNNVLFKMSSLGKAIQKFDAAYAHTGGEDTDFFHRLNQSGKKLVWCNEAPVSENVPPERTTISWVCRRSFRGGQTFFRIFISQYSLAAKGIWLFKKIIQIILAFLTLPFIALIALPSFIPLLCKLCAAIGQLSALFGNALTYNEYGEKRYQSDNFINKDNQQKNNE